MWDDDYQVEQDNIKAPEFLKIKTLQKMTDSREDHRNIFRLKPAWSIALSFLIIVVIALSWTTFSDSSPELITDLVFERLDGEPRRFAMISGNDNEYQSLAETETAIGISLSDLYFETFHLEGVSWVADENNIRIQYLFEGNGSSIRMLVNNHTDSVTTNSILNDLPLALYYRIVLLETVFTTEFFLDEVYYQIEATGLTEAEFIDYLKEILTFLK